jgi:hypothetical protein
MIKGDGIFMSKQEQFVYEIINDFIKGKMSREEVANSP